jgi:ankyrin repeat protein
MERKVPRELAMYMDPVKSASSAYWRLKQITEKKVQVARSAEQKITAATDSATKERHAIMEACTKQKFMESKKAASHKDEVAENLAATDLANKVGADVHQQLLEKQMAKVDQELADTEVELEHNASVQLDSLRDRYTIEVAAAHFDLNFPQSILVDSEFDIVIWSHCAQGKPDLLVDATHIRIDIDLPEGFTIISQNCDAVWADLMHFQYQVQCLPSCFNHQDCACEASVHYGDGNSSSSFSIPFVIRVGKGSHVGSMMREKDRAKKHLARERMEKERAEAEAAEQQLINYEHAQDSVDEWIDNKKRQNQADQLAQLWDKLSHDRHEMSLRHMLGRQREIRNLEKWYHYRRKGVYLQCGYGQTTTVVDLSKIGERRRGEYGYDSEEDEEEKPRHKAPFTRALSFEAAAGTCLKVSWTASCDTSSGESVWLETVDEKSGKRYYYNTHTLETSWVKPESDAERRAREGTEGRPRSQQQKQRGAGGKGKAKAGDGGRGGEGEGSGEDELEPHHPHHPEEYEVQLSECGVPWGSSYVLVNSRRLKCCCTSFTNLEHNTQYKVRVRARSSAPGLKNGGWGPWSDELERETGSLLEVVLLQPPRRHDHTDAAMRADWIRKIAGTMRLPVDRLRLVPSQALVPHHDADSETVARSSLMVQILAPADNNGDRSVVTALASLQECIEDPTKLIPDEEGRKIKFVAGVQVASDSKLAGERRHLPAYLRSYTLRPPVEVLEDMLKPGAGGPNDAFFHILAPRMVYAATDFVLEIWASTRQEDRAHKLLRLNKKRMKASALNSYNVQLEDLKENATPHGPVPLCADTETSVQLVMPRGVFEIDRQSEAGGGVSRDELDWGGDVACSSFNVRVMPDPDIAKKKKHKFEALVLRRGFPCSRLLFQVAVCPYVSGVEEERRLEAEATKAEADETWKIAGGYKEEMKVLVDANSTGVWRKAKILRCLLNGTFEVIYEKANRDKAGEDGFEREVVNKLCIKMLNADDLAAKAAVAKEEEAEAKKKRAKVRARIGRRVVTQADVQRISKVYACCAILDTRLVAEAATSCEWKGVQYGQADTEDSNLVEESDVLLIVWSTFAQHDSQFEQKYKSLLRMLYAAGGDKLGSVPHKLIVLTLDDTPMPVELTTNIVNYHAAVIRGSRPPPLLPPPEGEKEKEIIKQEAEEQAKSMEGAAAAADDDEPPQGPETSNEEEGATAASSQALITAAEAAVNSGRKHHQHFFVSYSKNHESHATVLAVADTLATPVFGRSDQEGELIPDPSSTGDPGGYSVSISPGFGDDGASAWDEERVVEEVRRSQCVLLLLDPQGKVLYDEGGVGAQAMVELRAAILAGVPVVPVWDTSSMEDEEAAEAEAVALALAHTKSNGNQRSAGGGTGAAMGAAGGAKSTGHVVDRRNMFWHMLSKCPDELKPVFEISVVRYSLRLHEQCIRQILDTIHGFWGFSALLTSAESSLAKERKNAARWATASAKPPTPPSAPRAVAMSANSVRAMWTQKQLHPMTSITHYVVEVLPAPPGMTEFEEVAVRAGGNAGARRKSIGGHQRQRNLDWNLVSGLEPNTAYRFRVRTKNCVGWSECSGWSEPTRTACIGAAPAEVSKVVVRSAHDLVVEWKQPAMSTITTSVFELRPPPPGVKESQKLIRVLTRFSKRKTAAAKVASPIFNSDNDHTHTTEHVILEHVTKMIEPQVAEEHTRGFSAHGCVLLHDIVTLRQEYNRVCTFRQPSKAVTLSFALQADAESACCICLLDEMAGAEKEAAGATHRAGVEMSVHYELKMSLVFEKKKKKKKASANPIKKKGKQAEEDEGPRATGEYRIVVRRYQKELWELEPSVRDTKATRFEIVGRLKEEGEDDEKAIAAATLEELQKPKTPAEVLEAKRKALLSSASAPISLTPSLGKNTAKQDVKKKPKPGEEMKFEGRVVVVGPELDEPLLDGNKSKPFWLTCENGRLKLGRGCFVGAEESVLLDWQDDAKEVVDVKHIALKTTQSDVDVQVEQRRQKQEDKRKRQLIREKKTVTDSGDPDSVAADEGLWRPKASWYINAIDHETGPRRTQVFETTITGLKPFTQYELRHRGDTDLYGGKVMEGDWSRWVDPVSTRRVEEDLLESAYNGDDVTAKRCLQEGADVNWRPDESEQAAEGKPGVRLKIPPHLRDGRTALMHASRGGHKGVLRALLKWGADAEAQDKAGATGLMLACVGDKLDCAALLVRHGVSLDTQSDRGDTALMAACRNGRAASARFLIRSGAAIEPEVSSGMTPNGTLRALADNDQAMVSKKPGVFDLARNKLRFELMRVLLQNVGKGEVAAILWELEVEARQRAQDEAQDYFEENSQQLVRNAKGKAGKAKAQEKVKRMGEKMAAVVRKLEGGYDSFDEVLTAMFTAVETEGDEAEGGSGLGSKREAGDASTLGQGGRSMVPKGYVQLADMLAPSMRLGGMLAPDQLQTMKEVFVWCSHKEYAREERTLLMHACVQGAYYSLLLLHEWLNLNCGRASAGFRRSLVDAQDSSGMSALMFAAKHANPRCVSVLLEMGADMRVTNKSGETAVAVAMAKMEELRRMQQADGGTGDTVQAQHLQLLLQRQQQLLMSLAEEGSGGL